jgi:pimeloyl-ACP methyl ester carboxylesterase
MKQQDVIILHGWNLSGDRFSPLTQVLEKNGYRVFAPDLPGFGKEPAPVKPWHVVDYAEFVHRYAVKNNIRQPVLIGHSFGGRVSLKYAELYGDTLRAMVLSGTPGFSPIPRKKLLFFLVIAKIGGFIFSMPPLNLLSDWARRWLYYAAGARDFFRAEGSMRETFKHIVQDNLITAMESVSIPTLLIWGEYDVIVPLAIAERMAEVMNNTTLKVVPEKDHGVPFKEPVIFATYVMNFLKNLK